MKEKVQEKQFTISFIFSKARLMRYISHLDLLRLLMRAARRASIPLYFTKGFNPHPKLRIKRALKLGLESEHEDAQLVLTKKIFGRYFVYLMNKQLPSGVRIKKAFYNI